MNYRHIIVSFFSLVNNSLLFSKYLHKTLKDTIFLSHLSKEFPFFMDGYHQDIPVSFSKVERCPVSLYCKKKCCRQKDFRSFASILPWQRTKVHITKSKISMCTWGCRTVDGIHRPKRQLFCFDYETKALANPHLQGLLWYNGCDE